MTECTETREAAAPAAYQQFLLSLALSVITSAAAVFVYHALSSAPPRFATLNVAELFSERQQELARLVSEGGGEAATEKALESAKAFGRQLEAEALVLPKECGCIVLVRGAVVGGTSLPDYTDLVRQRMRSR